MDPIVATIIAFLWFLPVLLEFKVETLLCSLSFIIPVLGAAYSIHLMRRILSEKSKAASIMADVQSLSRSTTLRRQEEFSHATEIIEELRSELLACNN